MPGLRFLSLSVPLGFLLFLAGCDATEPVTTITVDAEPAAQMAQMNAAIVFRDDVAWFFKMVGEVEAAQRQKPAMLEFLTSMQFSDEGLTNFQLPAGWSKDTQPPPASADDQKKELQNATTEIRCGGTGDPRLVISTLRTSFPSSAAESDPAVLKYLQDNLNRWRRQLTQPPMTLDASALPAEVFTTQTGETGRIFSIVGQSDPAGRFPFGRREFDLESYQAPAGWTVAKNDSFSKLAFEKSTPQGQLRLTVSPISGGDDASQILFSNVNRWLGQLGWAPIDERTIASLLKNREVDSHPTFLADLSSEGPVTRPDGSKTDSPQSILGGITLAEKSVWVFKLMGPKEAVGQEEAAFESFLDSIKLKPLPRGQQPGA